MLFGQLKCCDHWDILFQADFNAKKDDFKSSFLPDIFLFGNMINQTLPKYYNGTFNILLSRTFSWDTDRATFVSEEH